MPLIDDAGRTSKYFQNDWLAVHDIRAMPNAGSSLLRCRNVQIFIEDLFIVREADKSACINQTPKCSMTGKSFWEVHKLRRMGAKKFYISDYCYPYYSALSVFR
jgi:hypothetical protein